MLIFQGPMRGYIDSSNNTLSQRTQSTIHSTFSIFAEISEWIRHKPNQCQTFGRDLKTLLSSASHRW